MAWEDATFTNGTILYAESLDVLQSNFGALAAQESGAPMLDVSCSNINLLTSSAFICDVGSFGAAHVGTGDISVRSGHIDLLTVDSMTAQNFNMNSGDIGSLAVNSLMSYRGKPAYPCRAWVSFNGSSGGTIYDDENVTSITDNGVGDYTVNFTVAIPTSDYAVSLSISNVITGTVQSPKIHSTNALPTNAPTLKTPTQLRIVIGYGSAYDSAYVTVAVFG